MGQPGVSEPAPQMGGRCHFPGFAVEECAVFPADTALRGGETDGGRPERGADKGITPPGKAL